MTKDDSANDQMGTIHRKSMAWLKNKSTPEKSAPKTKLKDNLKRPNKTPTPFPNTSQPTLHHNGPLRGKVKGRKIMLKIVKEISVASSKTYRSMNIKTMAMAIPITICRYFGVSL